MEDRARSRSPVEELLPDADARLLQQIRSGDAEAGQRYVREHYGAVYRYLLYLTGQPDLARDLTQETFLQGWRCLDTFQGWGSLRNWLHRIAHRQFLHWLRLRQAELGWEGMAEVAAPSATAWMESVELREVIDRLPLEQREVVLLHYLEGYSSTEIAPIVGAPASTVRRRLAQAREHLRQALDEDDLSHLNEPSVPMRQWAWLPLDQMYALEMRLIRAGTADRNPPGPGVTTEESMERREFLRQAAVGAAGLMLSETEKEVVDSRLTQKVTLTFKGTALSDLCEHLRGDTGVHLVAGPSVADEKVTLFCEKLPLRDVMRQLSRPSGYTWLRSGKSGEYRYELVQDLKSQLLEEELRNRDRNAALIDLDEEIKRYRPYLPLSPDEALAQSKTAPPKEKKLLEALAGTGWGPIQMYFQLSPQEQAALRAGQELTFGQEPRPDQQPLPTDLAGGVLQSVRAWRMIKGEKAYWMTNDLTDPRSVAATAVPELRAQVRLRMPQSELGQFTLQGHAGFRNPETAQNLITSSSRDPLAVGMSPGVLQPKTGSGTPGSPASRRCAGPLPSNPSPPTGPPCRRGRPSTDRRARRMGPTRSPG